MRSQRFRISKKPLREARKSAQKAKQQAPRSPFNKVKDEQTHNEQLAFVVEDKGFDSSGEECELHVYETRLDTRGDEVCLRAGTKIEFEPLKKRSHRACLVLYRYYTSDRELFCTELEIQSRHIITALREVIVTYPGVDFTSKSVTIPEPPRCLFHHQDELRGYAKSSRNKRLKSHMQLCLQYMEKTLYKEIKILNSVKFDQSTSFELEHRHLWILFKPGCLVYHKGGRADEFLSRFQSISSLQNSKGEIESWQIGSERTAWNGSGIGMEKRFTNIPRYDGRKPVCDLAAIPLAFLPEEQRIRRDLLERGRKFLSLCGTRHCFYDGSAFLFSISSPNTTESDVVNVSLCSRSYVKIFVNRN